MGRLAGIARRERKRAPMETLESAQVSTLAGVDGDSRGKPGPRQVTVLSASSWHDACRELGADLPWRGGVSCTVLEGGPIAVGDAVTLEAASRSA